MKSGLYGKIRFFLVWALVFTLAFPAPLFSGTISSGDPNEMVLRRLNSPERAAASARMHEEYAKQQAELTTSEGKEKTASKVEKKPSAPPSGSLVAGSGAAGTQKTSTGSANVAPRSATEVIFNQGASLVGLPGLAPREGVDGSRDEGRGFHQDGTARRVDTDDGRRSTPAYMRAGLSGQEKITPGLYDDAARLEELASSGGRISGQSSREFDDLDPNELFLNRGLNYGSGIVNSWGESVLSGLVDGGRARLNYRLDSDGDVAGEGDALFPWYDGTYTTVFTQIGARSMTDDEKTRWIGNFGLGQRWFPFASGEIGSPDYDAGTLMVGYNAFFDYDFTRSHQRGGVGAELQYDWLRLSSNYYFPLSDWKGSYDFDSSLVEERPAEGWDARIKAYLPFYRNVALTGSYSRWYGDNVGVYGASDPEKNPRVWSYGIEYTPVPLVSAFLRQKSTEHGRTDTEFGLTFNYHFGMSLEEQTSPTKVAELRTVGGSRHEFVDRENKIILEYRAKNAFRIEYVGKAGTNRFNFRLVNGFDRTVSGQMVHASVTDATFPNGTDFATFVTGGNGEFTLALDTVMATPVPAVIQAGETTGTFQLDAELTALDMKASPNTLTQHKAQSVTFTVTRKDGSPMSGASVAFDSSAAFTGLSRTYTTDGSGKFTVSGLTAVLSGEQSLSAKVNGKTTAKTQFTVTAATYGLTADRTTLNQHERHDVTFTLTRNGEAVPGLSVLFTKGEGFASLPADAQATDASGQFKVTGLTPILSGQQTVEVLVDGEGKTQMTFNVSEANYTLSTIDTLEQWEPARAVTFTLNTSQNTPVPNVTVNYTISGLGVPDLTGSTTTDDNGEFTVDNVATTLSTDAKASVTLGNKTVETDIKVTGATYVLSTSDKLAQRENAKPLTFTLKTSPNNTPVRNATVTYTISNLGGTAVTGTATTNNNGEFTTDPVATTLEAMANVEVTVDGKTVSGTIDVTSATYQLSTSDTLEQWEPGKSLAFTLTTYPSGTPVRNAEVTYTISNLGTPEVTDTATTDNNGTFTVNGVATTLDTAATASVTVDGKPATTTIQVTPVTYKLEADPVNLTRYEPENVTFTLKTAKGTPVPNVSVTLAANSKLGLGETTENTNASGQIQNVSLTPIENGQQTVQASVDGQSPSVQFTVSQGNFKLEANPSSLLQYEQQNVTFTLKTAKGTPVPNVSVTLAANADLGLSETTKTTDASGQIQNVSLTPIKDGQQTMTVTVDGETVPVQLTVTSATYDLSVSPQTLIQHVGTNVTFTIKRNNKTVSGLAVNFAASADLGLSAETRNTDDSGQITLNLTPTATGAKTVQVTVDGKTLTTQLQVDPPSYTLETSDSLSQYDSGDVTFTVKRNGQTVSGLSVVFTANSALGLTAVTKTTDGSGRVTVTGLKSATAGQKTVEVTVDGLGKASTNLTVTEASFILTTVSQTLTRHEPNGSAEFRVTTQAKGSPVPDTQVSIAANSNLGLSSKNLSTDLDGKFTLDSLTPALSGAQKVNATVNGKSVQGEVTVDKAQYRLAVTSSTNPIQHEPNQKVTFKLTTSNGHPASSVQVTFASNSNLSGLAGPYTTLADGSFTVDTLTVKARTAQQVTVNVDTNEGSASATLNVTPAQYKLTATDLIQYEPGNVTFTLVTSYGTKVSGLKARFTKGDGLNLPSDEQTPNASGQFTVNNLQSASYGDFPIAVRVDNEADADASLHVKEVTFEITGVTGGGDFVSGKSTTATFTAQMLADGTAYAPSSSATVTWSVTAADNSPNKAVMDSHKSKKTGLAWGTNGPGTSAGNELTSTTTSTLSGTTGAQVQLADIMGQRKVTMKAEVSMYGQSFTATKEFTFGKGPLSVFAGAPKGNMTWASAVSACGGTAYVDNKLPSQGQLQAVAGTTGNYAYLAAGWPDDRDGQFYYWRDETYGLGAWCVNLLNGSNGFFDAALSDYPLAVCIP